MYRCPSLKKDKAVPCLSLTAIIKKVYQAYSSIRQANRKSVVAFSVPPCGSSINVYTLLDWGARKVTVPVLPVSPASNKTGRVVLFGEAIVLPDFKRM